MQIVPFIERGLEEGKSTDIYEVFTALEQGEDLTGGQTDSKERTDSEYKDSGKEVERGGIAAAIYKISSFKMFVLDTGLDIVDREKLRYIWKTLDYNDII